MENIMHECELYMKDEDEPGSVYCYSCNKRCHLEHGKPGHCGIRYNKNGKLYLAVYGYPTVIRYGNIKRHLFSHFQTDAKAMCIGTVGCNFSCKGCNTWIHSQSVKPIKASVKKAIKSNTGDIEDLAVCLQSDKKYVSPAEAVDMAISEACSVIIFGDNEPTIWGEYAHDIAKIAHERGLKTAYDTNGFMTTEHLKYIQPYVDALNIDLKAGSAKYYRQICKGNIEMVKKTIQLAINMGFWVEISTVLDAENSTDDEFKKMVGFLLSVDSMIPWHLLRVIETNEMNDISFVSMDRLRECLEMSRVGGLKRVYLYDMMEQ